MVECLVVTVIDFLDLVDYCCTFHFSFGEEGLGDEHESIPDLPMRKFQLISHFPGIQSFLWSAARRRSHVFRMIQVSEYPSEESFRFLLILLVEDDIQFSGIFGRHFE